MKERFKRLPEALQKQVIYRLGAGVIFLLCTILILIFHRDIYLLLPSLCFAVFFVLNGLWVFLEIDAGKYVVVEGCCTGIERTPLRKRIKNIHIETDDITVKVIVKQRMKQLAIGDNIRVYVFEKTPVYDQEQCKLLCSYLALEKTRREMGNGDSRGFIADSGRDQENDSGEL